jgi:hypothetical protein
VLEPRTPPPPGPDTPAAEVAFQTGGQPTRKVSAASNVGGSVAAVLAGVMAGYGGPAIMELLGEYGSSHPSVAQFLIMIATSVAAFIATKYGGQAAAYNVLDKPNVPLTPVSPAP